MKAVAQENRVLIPSLLADLQQQYSAIEIAGAEFAQGIGELFEPVRAAVAAFNETARTYNEAIEDETSRIEEFIEPKGDRWRSNHGDAYDAWHQALADARVEEIAEPEEPVLDVSGEVPEQTPPLRLDEVVL